MRTRDAGSARFSPALRLLAGSLAVYLAVPSSVFAANREHLQLLADLRMLQEQTQQLQLMVGAVTESLRTVTTRLDQQAEANRKAFADQKLLIDTLTGDLRVLREKLDDTNVRVSSLQQELDALRQSIPATLPTATPPVTPAGDTATAPPGTDAATPPAPAVNPAAGLSPQRLYDQAYADFASGQWSLAVQGFDTFIRTFPRSEQADKAQFYIGESHLLDGKFDQAVAAYDKVIANYPSGEQAPLAYYKKGLALVRLGQPDRARDAWDTVIKKYPNSDASVLAKQGLDRLTRPSR